jgi:hypothetical protein
MRKAFSASTICEIAQNAEDKIKLVGVAKQAEVSH